MLIENKNYKTRNGKVVFNIFKRNTMTDENIVSYVLGWILENKDPNVLKDEIEYKVSSGVKFPFIGVMYIARDKKWLITNWTIDGKFDLDPSPNDLITLLR